MILTIAPTLIDVADWMSIKIAVFVFDLLFIVTSA